MRFQDIIPLPVRKFLGGTWHAVWQNWQNRRLRWRLRGHGIECNVCGWEGGSLADDSWHPGTVCPSCRSQVRHRMLAALFDDKAGHPEWAERELFYGRAVLHFAPERQLRDRIRRAAGRYVTADYDRGDTDLRLDLSAMPSVSDASFDVVIACDVLEHVPDDATAFRELFRVLKPGGIAILTVPQKDPPASTDEDSAVIEETERLERFGQHDHVRMYGDDFPTRAAGGGFTVETIQAGSFPSEVRQRHVLAPPVRSSHPLATNERRIYFCGKAD